MFSDKQSLSVIKGSGLVPVGLSKGPEREQPFNRVNGFALTEIFAKLNLHFRWADLCISI